MHSLSNLWEAFKYSFVIAGGIATAGAMVAGGVQLTKAGVGQVIAARLGFGKKNENDDVIDVSVDDEAPVA